MKKTYEAPIAEKIEFRYEDQIVASNGTAYDLAHDGCDRQPDDCKNYAAGMNSGVN